MKILVFDTETTGLPHESSLPATQSPNNWPHIVSISWAVLDSESNSVMKTHCYIVKPEKWTISVESTRIHGITQAQALDFGLPLLYVIDQFNSEQFDLMVAHNLNFDMNVLINAIMWDLGVPFHGFAKRKACTMTIGKPMCKLLGRYGYKQPKLSELYKHVTGQLPKSNQLHNALFDTLYLCEIIQKSSEIRIQMGLAPVHTNNANQEVQRTQGAIQAPNHTGNKGSTGPMVR
jgi:DNA polymerase III epsilon subunit-like protein